MPTSVSPPSREEQEQPPRHKRNPPWYSPHGAFRHLLPQLVRNRWGFVLGFLLILLANLFSAAIPYLLKLATESLETRAPTGELLSLAALLVLFSVLHGYFRVKSRTQVYLLGRSMEYELRQSYHAALQRLPASFLLANRTGDLVSRGTADMTAVRMFVGPGFLQIVTTSIIFAVTLPVMFLLNPTLAMLTLVPLPLFLLAARLLTGRLYRKSKIVVDRFGDLSAFIQESVAGMATLRDHAGEERWSGRLSAKNRDLHQATLAHNRVQSLFAPVMTLAGSLGTLILLAHGGGEVVAGRLTVGDFVAFSGYITLLVWPTVGMGWILSVIQRGAAAMERIAFVLDQPHDPAWNLSDSPPAHEEGMRGEIRVEGLTFAYPGGPPLLSDISFHAPPGHFIGLVGRVGSGKSTLLSLMARLLPLQEGVIHLSGQDLATLPEAELRRMVAMAPQESYLFSTTIRENILFGAPGAGADHALAMAERAAFDEELATFPQGLETQVGERGVILSGGQRQRAALARALAADPEVLLLDDVFSSVDARTEERILNHIHTRGRGPTVMLVCHRVAALHQADTILLLDQGRIIARGSHGQLWEESQLYRDLHARMSKQEALEELDQGLLPENGP